MKKIFMLVGLILLCSAAFAVCDDVDGDDGDDDCSKGLFYFCTSMATAERCNAVELCKRFAWMNRNEVRNQALVRMDQAGDDPVCRDCVQLMTSLKTLLLNNTETLIEDLLVFKVCPKLKDKSNPCQQLVKNALPFVFQLIFSFYDANKLCALMKACPKAADQLENNEFDLSENFISATDLQWQELIPAFVKDSNGQPDDRKCMACQWVMNFMVGVFTSQDVQNSWKKLCYKQVCKTNAKTCQKTCDDFVSYIFKLIAERMDPLKTCRDFHQCPKTTSNSLDKNEPELGKQLQEQNNPIPCLMCKSLVDILEGTVKDNATEETFLKIIGNVCNGLPGPFRKTCRLYVASYAKKLLEMLIKHFDPDTICTKLHLCTEWELDDNEVEQLGVDLNICQTCIDVTNFLEGLLEKNETINFIEAILKRICNLLPKPSQKSKCTSYGDSVIQFSLKQLKILLPPQTLCKLIRMCKSDASSGESVPVITHG